MTVFGPPSLVLLAENHRDTRDMYAWYLSTVGFLVIEARDGHETLQRAEACRPDVIAMDLSLPGLGACAVIRRLHDRRRTTRIPIIGLNGFGFRHYAEEAMQAGCRHVLAKPCSPDALAKAIRRMLMTRCSARLQILAAASY